MSHKKPAITLNKNGVIMTRAQSNMGAATHGWTKLGEEQYHLCDCGHEMAFDGEMRCESCGQPTDTRKLSSTRKKQPAGGMAPIKSFGHVNVPSAPAAAPGAVELWEESAHPRGDDGKFTAGDDDGDDDPDRPHGYEWTPIPKNPWVVRTKSGKAISRHATADEAKARFEKERAGYKRRTPTENWDAARRGRYFSEYPCGCGHVMRFADQMRCDGCGQPVDTRRVRAIKMYSPDQPRDDNGQFASGGGGPREIDPNSGKPKPLHNPASAGPMKRSIWVGEPQKLPGGVTRTKRVDGAVFFNGPGTSMYVNRQKDMYLEDKRKPWGVHAEGTSSGYHSWHATQEEAEKVAADLARGDGSVNQQKDLDAEIERERNRAERLDSDEGILTGAIIEQAIQRYGPDWLSYLAKVHAPAKK